MPRTSVRGGELVQSRNLATLFRALVGGIEDALHVQRLIFLDGQFAFAADGSQEREDLSGLAIAVADVVVGLGREYAVASVEERWWFRRDTGFGTEDRVPEVWLLDVRRPTGSQDQAVCRLQKITCLLPPLSLSKQEPSARVPHRGVLHLHLYVPAHQEV